ncbi:MAG TPA: BatA and WFA domain-containing protein [Candidatus Dormibacteraeota bacterium]|nr:BatA and WFA domain-containing protein [Candidatus Dormibacteraeota bacterium]
MSFLSPALFAVLAPLLFLPLFIHLLSKGFPKQFKFPSLELLKQTTARRSKLHRWRHWILILLRTAFLLLLALAFLMPVLRKFGNDPAAQGGRTVLIVLDHSASMEHRGDGPPSRERAAHEAAKLIDSLGVEDVVNVLLLGANPTTCFVDFSKDHAMARQFVARLKPGFTRGDVNLANTLAGRLISKNASRPEVYYISDFQRKNWANANFTSLPAAAKLFFVDVGPTRRDNHAVLDAHPAETQILAGDTVAIAVALGNFSGEPFNGRVTVTVDRRFSFDQEVSIAPWSQSRVTVPVSAGGPGTHLCEVQLPPDALECDDRFHLTLTVRDKEEVLIVTDGAHDQKSGAYFLKTALNPFENEAGSLLPRVIGRSELTASRLAGVRKVFFTQIAALPEPAAAAIATFLLQGGALIYFLDGNAEVQNLAALERVLGPNTMPLRLAQRRTASQVGQGAQQVVRGDFKSPYLKLFQGAARQNLALLEFYDYYQAGATRAGGVVLSYADDSPALASLHHGLGTMLLLNFSAGELSSNLARQRIFPAWIQELVKATTADEAPPAAHVVGELLQTEIWRSEMRNDDFKSPSGSTVAVKREPTGDRYRISFTPDQLGFYTLGAARPTCAFGINPSAEEADLRPIEKDVLPKEFASEREAHYVAGAEEFQELAKGRPLYQWFILGALAVLLMESGFQLLLRRAAA